MNVIKDFKIANIMYVSCSIFFLYYFVHNRRIQVCNK